jgi:hypothetical protein
LKKIIITLIATLFITLAATSPIQAEEANTVEEATFTTFSIGGDPGTGGSGGGGG